MTSISKVAIALGLVAFAAACQPREPEPVVYTPPAPIVAEPTYNKY